jgi:hypothetical protein
LAFFAVRDPAWNTSADEPRNATREAKLDENMVIIQNEEPLAVAANSGVDSPLDKWDNLPCGAHR